MIKCPYCGVEMGVMADVTITIPSSYYRKLTKETFRKKELQIWGVDWEYADFICPKCGFVKRRK